MSSHHRRLHAVSSHLSPVSDSLSLPPFVVSSEVSAALRSGAAVVALESTIISHGMPFPRSLHVAQQVERVVRARGAVPATVAVLDGAVHVGLSDAQLERLARGPAVKVSRRDLAVCCARGVVGATTVSATLLVACALRIPVFVTGGIGGVHRGASASFDISADLPELGRAGGTAVVCAGVKSILDISATLEMLETLGVTVASIGQDDFPAFFTPSSGLPSPLRLDTVDDAAAVVLQNRRLQLGSGMLFAVPVPAAAYERYKSAAQGIEVATQTALAEAEKNGIRGRDVTPFLLKRVAQLTGDVSLELNVELILNNAAVGAQIAVLVARASAPVHVCVVGAALQDMAFQSDRAEFVRGDSNPGRVQAMAFGGVARNVCEALARTAPERVRASFFAVLGDDDTGRAIRGQLQGLGVNVAGCALVPSVATPAYVSFLDKRGELVGAMACTSPVEEHGKRLALPPDVANACQVLVLDCNLLADDQARIANSCRNAQVWIEPTSLPKCERAIPLLKQKRVFGISPNVAEFKQLATLLGASIPVGDAFDEKVIRSLAAPFAAFNVGVILLKLGAQGSAVISCADGIVKSVSLFASPKVETIVSVTGAGDVLLGSFLAQHYGLGSPVAKSMGFANDCVALCLASKQAVPETLPKAN